MQIAVAGEILGEFFAAEVFGSARSWAKSLWKFCRRNTLKHFQVSRSNNCVQRTVIINHGKHFYKSKRIEEIKLSSMHQVCWRLRKLRKLRWLIRDTSIFPSQLTNLRSQVSKLQSQVSKLRRKNQGVPYEQPYSRQWLRAIYGSSKSLQAFIQSRSYTIKLS